VSTHEPLRQRGDIVLLLSPRATRGAWRRVLRYGSSDGGDFVLPP